jgi:glyoxylase-like metal-dependent hydrolase (beta-lactamase superfamily II)
VLISHAHADHIGGLLDADGRSAFPRATIVIGHEEYQFWRNSGFREQLGTGSVYGNAPLEGAIAQWFDRYLVAIEDQLQFAVAGTEAAPGITAVAAAGHTPGQLAFLIEDGSRRTLYTADAFSLPDHVEHPEWTCCFDLDPHKTVATRQRLLDLASSEECRVIHYHVDSFGHVERRGSSYAWQPETETEAGNAVAAQVHP